MVNVRTVDVEMPGKLYTRIFEKNNATEFYIRPDQLVYMYSKLEENLVLDVKYQFFLNLIK
jgi:hypothetical protein